MKSAAGQGSVRSDAELLATVIRHSGGASEAGELAARLLSRFGGLRQLLHADTDALMSEHGIGAARSAAIRAIPEIAQRYYEATLPPGQSIRSPSDTKAYFQARIRHLGHEMFCCLFLDNRHRVLRFDEMFRGTIDGTSVYPREVVKEALAINAAAVILAHNHPSGIAEPSQADIRITENLKQALALVDIRLLDRVIVGDGITCLSEQGLV